MFLACVIGGLVMAGIAVIAIYNLREYDFNRARVGETYNLTYLQPVTGDKRRYRVKVMEVRPMTEEDILRLDRTSNYRRYDPNFERSGNLVTGMTRDGKIRNFYARRTSRVRRCSLLTW